MSYLIWIIAGLVVGVAFSKFSAISDDSYLVADINLGVVSAVAGGWLLSATAVPGIPGPTIFGVIASTVISAISLLVYHAFVESTR